MKKVLKWIGIVLGSLIGLILLAGTSLYFVGRASLTKVYDIPPSGIVLPTDEASLERGKHIVETACTGCHGTDLGGIRPFFDMDGIAAMDSVNLTSGEGGIGNTYTDEDYVRAIRHGVSPDGTPNYMPTVPYFQYMSDEDLGAVVAYIRSVPSVDRITSSFHAEPLGYILFAAGAFGEMPAEVVLHQNNVTAPEPGITVEYGEYRLRISACQDCHGMELAGGPYPDPSVTYTVPNLTPGGNLNTWTEEQFIQTIRTQMTPDGRGLNPSLMPFEEVNRLSDDELKAIWLYLRSLPSLEQVMP
ncbi:MAG: c-type cytochrome [Flavobacteriales bacterium]|nr:c-type cytochrome [Flavobacteriales bacterium]